MSATKEAIDSTNRSDDARVRGPLALLLGEEPVRLIQSPRFCLISMASGGTRRAMPVRFIVGLAENGPFDRMGDCNGNCLTMLNAARFGSTGFSADRKESGGSLPRRRLRVFSVTNDILGSVDKIIENHDAVVDRPD